MCARWTARAISRPWAFRQTIKSARRCTTKTPCAAPPAPALPITANTCAALPCAAEIGPFRAGQLGRITQLINKTNQFNLTTRRYTEAEVAACMQDEGCITLAGRLEDKFGDNGLVSAIIAACAAAPCTLSCG